MPSSKPAGGLKLAGSLAVLLLAALGYFLKVRAESAAPSAAADHSVASTSTAHAPSATAPPPAAPSKPAASAPASAPAAPTASKPAATPPAPAPTTASVELRFGSWNIEWLGKPSERSGAGKDVAQDPADLADCIVASRVAVLGVCEIVATIPGRPLRSEQIEATLDALKKKTGDTWKYILFPGRRDGDQLTGVLWNTSLVTAETAADKPFDPARDAPWPLPIPKTVSSQSGYLWNRPPNAMKFSAGPGKTDFVLIVIHMKADYPGDFSPHRKEEADALLAVLPAVKKQFHDDDIILLGDTNCTGEHEPAIAAFEKSGFFDLNAAHRATHWRGGSMDRALVPTSQPEFAAHAFEVMSDPYLNKRGIDAREYKRRYSDHFMIVTTLKVMPDDD